MLPWHGWSQVYEQSDLCRVLTSPFDGRTCIAVAPLRADLAVLHAELATADGEIATSSDTYFDREVGIVADALFVTAERVIASRSEGGADLQWYLAERVGETYIAEVPGGAAPGSCRPLYGANPRDAQSRGPTAATRSPSGRSLTPPPTSTRPTTGGEPTKEDQLHEQGG